MCTIIIESVFKFLIIAIKLLTSIHIKLITIPFPILFKFLFIYQILYKPCIFKAYRLSNVQTLCIFPYFCPYQPKQGQVFVPHRLPYQQPCGSTLRFPCGMNVNVHCGTYIGVSEKLLHIFGDCPVRYAFDRL